MLFLHLLRLLARALVAMPALISGNWLSVLLPLLVFFAKEAGTLRKGWNAVRATIKRDTWIMVGAYVLLLGWAVVRTIYSDHEDLVQRSRILSVRLAKGSSSDAYVLQQTKNSLGESITALKVQCGIFEGMNRALGQQNRDQQNLIGNCQNEALKLLVPAPFKMTSVEMKSENGSIQSISKSQMLLLTNQAVSPVKIQVSCNRELLEVAADLIGEQMEAMSSPQRVDKNSFLVGIELPAWTPDRPLILNISHRGSADGFVCVFQKF